MREEYIREKIKEAQEVIMQALEALEHDRSEEELHRFDQEHGTLNDKVVRESTTDPSPDENRDVSAY